MSEVLSVVITCHNLEKYIAAAIESALNQDYQGSVDVLVIDDCSTDRSAEIIKSYESVRYLRPEQNLGVLMATVLGVESTVGELVFFLDGDDVWETTKLSTVVERFRADSKLGLVTHDLAYIDSHGNVLDRKTRVEDAMASIRPSSEGKAIRDGILLHSDYVWLGSAYAVHRTLGDLEGFCTFAKGLPDPFNTYQDWPLAFWVACQPGVVFGYVPLKLFRYRLHGANHSGDASSVAKAIRNVRRARNTMQAISEIADRFTAEAHVRKATDSKLAFYKYLEDLYSGHKWHAMTGFFSSLAYLMNSPEPLLKEAVRFVAVQFFGIERFISLASIRNRRRTFNS
jgi:glycosyltransferase involved in cell wall biosynthesis